MTAEAYAGIERSGHCLGQRCIAYVIGDDRIALIRPGDNVLLLAPADSTGKWYGYDEHPPSPAPATLGTADDLEKATVEVRQITRRQVFVNGEAMGDNFE